MQPTVDLRSDTVTKPTTAMFTAMQRAELGDDVLGDDPTVKALEARTAQMLGKEAACFMPSGTMANQSCIRAHTQPGDEIITHKDSHVYVYEAGAWAALSGCSIQLIEGDRGTFTGENVRDALRPENDHFPRSRLLCVENTHNRAGGTIWSRAQCADVLDAARRSSLRTHLDGARLFNAHVASGVPIHELADGFDTVSVCFSKGLGAPVGSAAAGSEQTIHRVRRIRKMFGGGMRQSGLLAAACIHAVDFHIDRLAQDHENAHMLASAVADLPGLHIDPAHVQTNILSIQIDPDAFADGARGLVQSLGSRGVHILATGPDTVRAVTNLNVDRAGIEHAIDAFRQTVANIAV